MTEGLQTAVVIVAAFPSKPNSVQLVVLGVAIAAAVALQWTSGKTKNAQHEGDGSGGGEYSTAFSPHRYRVA